MPRSFKALGFLLVMLLGLYGCAKAPTGPTSNEASKVRKLEEDYQAAAKARDDFRLELAAAQEQQAKTLAELEQTRTERESLKGQVSARTAERDALNVQYEKFRSTLKELIGSADTTVGALNLPAPKPQADQKARK